MTIQPIHQPSEVLPIQGLWETDQRRLREAFDQAMEPNTRRAFSQAWGRFEAWAKARDVSPLPASPQMVAAYLAELAAEGP